MTNKHIKLYLAGLYKQLVWNTTRINNNRSEKDIFILTSRRSGSTWFAEVLSTNKGNKLVDQPLSVYRLGLGDYASIPIMESGQFISLSHDEQLMLKKYVQEILTGERHVNEPWKFWEPTFSFNINRHVLKITDASSLIDWFSREFDAHMIYLLRHPIPQAISCIDRKWSLTSKAYLMNKYFIENHLKNGLEDYSWDIWNKGTKLQNFVLNWVFENLIPLKKIESLKNCHMFNYEENVLFPLKTIDILISKLHLSDAELLQNRFYKPSKNMDSGTKAFNRLENINNADEFKFMIERWRKRVDNKEEKKVMKILERFELDVYEAGKLIANKKYCNFK